MPKLKSKNVEIENNEQEVVKEETEQLAPIPVNDTEEVHNVATTERLQLATNIVSSRFNLDDTFRVSKFNDKGKVVNLDLENEDFILAVTIKDGNRQGMIVE